MTVKEAKELKRGDTIEFRSPTRDSNRKVKRKITTEFTPHIWKGGAVGVSYNGWQDFWVKVSEIIKKID